MFILCQDYTAQLGMHLLCPKQNSKRAEQDEITQPSGKESQKNVKFRSKTRTWKRTKFITSKVSIINSVSLILHCLKVTFPKPLYIFHAIFFSNLMNDITEQTNLDAVQHGKEALNVQEDKIATIIAISILWILLSATARPLLI